MLLPRDTNGESDVYMWENGEIELISTGRDASPSRFADASASGGDAFFVTGEQLVGWDEDDAFDMYDARVGGGLPEPPAPPVACSGDECQGPPAGRPSLAGSGSEGFHGDGDARPTLKAAFRLLAPSATQRARLVRIGRLTLRVPVNRAGKVSARATMRLRGGGRQVARRSKRARRAGTVLLTLRLSRDARARLQRTGRLKLTIAVRFTGVRAAKRLTLNLNEPAVAKAGGRS
jgi:hypothetical protein